MANLYLSGVARRGAINGRPVSVIEAFGGQPVPACWSGLYGNASTREGLKRLIRGAGQPVSVYRVTCRVPGDLTTSIGRDDLASLGYLNMRYAQAELRHELMHAWAYVTGKNVGESAMHQHPEAVVEALDFANIPKMAVIIHPFETPREGLLLNIATVLDNSAIAGYNSRDKSLALRLPSSQP